MATYVTPQATHFQNGATRPGQNTASGFGTLQNLNQALGEMSLQNNSARPSASIVGQSGMFAATSGLPLYAVNPNAVPVNTPQSQVQANYPMGVPYASHVYQYPSVYPQYYAASAPYPYGYAIQMMPVTPPNSAGSLPSSVSEPSPQTPYQTVPPYTGQSPSIASIDQSPLQGYSYTNNAAAYVGFQSSAGIQLQGRHEYARLGASPYVHEAMEKHRFAHLLSMHPPIPWAIPAVYTAKSSLKSLEESLQNPLRIKNVYIRGFAPDTTDDLLLAYACRFGRVVNHKAMIDPHTGTCKGFGFAKFSTFLEAELCIRGFYLRNYEVGFARESFNERLKAFANVKSTNLYVSNLPREMTETELNAIFFGFEVESSRILRDSHGNSRGVGFARFTSRQASDEVIKLFHGQPIGRDSLLLQVRYADTEEQKKLKDETTRRRQFRATEYSASARSVGHGTEYVALAGSVDQSPEPILGFRGWADAPLPVNDGQVPQTIQQIFVKPKTVVGGSTTSGISRGSDIGSNEYAGPSDPCCAFSYIRWSEMTAAERHQWLSAGSPDSEPSSDASTTSKNAVPSFKSTTSVDQS